MSATVFANGNGLFHSGSSGSGTAFPDVCLSPPPPPAGPVPIPYPNRASASDLADGSKTVKIQGNPTALKDKSYVKTSTGNEAATQGGGVVTHKTKGKAYFQFWSFDVKIEGLNVDTHGDPMGQNGGSSINGVCLRSSVVRNAWNAAQNSDCTVAYDNDKHHVEPSADQSRQAKAELDRTGVCWECKQPPNGGRYDDDHYPPLCLLWYAGGCKLTPMPEAWKEAAKKVRCRPHCSLTCSKKQSGTMKKLNNRMKAKLAGG